jgi:uncharacterized protein YegP (UPF0339 family)
MQPSDIASVTIFDKSVNDGMWYWRTRAANGEIVAVGGEGYHNYADAVHGYNVAQGTTDAPERPSQVGPDRFSITKYKSQSKNSRPEGE